MLVPLEFRPGLLLTTRRRWGGWGLSPPPPPLGPPPLKGLGEIFFWVFRRSKTFSGAFGAISFRQNLLRCLWPLQNLSSTVRGGGWTHSPMSPDPPPKKGPLVQTPCGRHVFGSGLRSPFRKGVGGVRNVSPSTPPPPDVGPQCQCHAQCLGQDLGRGVITWDGGQWFGLGRPASTGRSQAHTAEEVVAQPR